MPYGYKVTRRGADRPGVPVALVESNTWMCWGCGRIAPSIDCCACRAWDSVHYPAGIPTTPTSGQPVTLFREFWQAARYAYPVRDIWSCFYVEAPAPPSACFSVPPGTAFASRVMLCCLVRPGRPAQ